MTATAAHLGLDPRQFDYARRIVAVGARLGMPERAAHIAIAVALAESELQMWANSDNPESLRLPHDAVGCDHGSVGLFQQQVGGAVNSTANWGTTAELMDVETSAGKFYRALHSWVRDNGGWGRQFGNGRAAQAVQGAAFPHKYAERDAEAIVIANALWPGGKALRPDPAPQRSITVTVRPGDTLFAIAQRYRTTHHELARINGLQNPDLILPGQRLVVPLAT